MHCMLDEIQFTQYIYPFGGQHGGDEVWLDHRWHGQFYYRFISTILSPSCQRSSDLHLPQILIWLTLGYSRFWSSRSVQSHTILFNLLNGNWSNRGKKSMVKLSVLLWSSHTVKHHITRFEKKNDIRINRQRIVFKKLIKAFCPVNSAYINSPA